MKIGLTGSIGTGKSTVSKFFKSKGIMIIDADKIAKEIMNDEQCIYAITSVFGSSVLDNAGKINRIFLRNLIFSNSIYRKTLENITHPLINKKMDEEYELYKNNDFVIFDIPLLFETGNDKLMDKVIVVACEEKLQLSRITKRDCISSLEAKQIINTQTPQKEKIKRADFIIYNNSDLVELEKNVELILKKIKFQK